MKRSMLLMALLMMASPALAVDSPTGWAQVAQADLQVTTKMNEAEIVPELKPPLPEKAAPLTKDAWQAEFNALCKQRDELFSRFDSWTPADKDEFKRITDQISKSFDSYWAGETDWQKQEIKQTSQDIKTVTTPEPKDGIKWQVASTKKEGKVKKIVLAPYRGTKKVGRGIKIVYHEANEFRKDPRGTSKRWEGDGTLALGQVLQIMCSVLTGVSTTAFAAGK